MSDSCPVGRGVGHAHVVTVGYEDTGMDGQPVDKGGGNGALHQLVERTRAQVGADGEAASSVGRVSLRRRAGL